VSNVKSDLLALLAEKERRLKTRTLDTLYPEVGLLRRELYPKHMEFFAAGKQYRERCMMAGNRIGKSYGAGGYEMTLHLTGLYPDWWKGRRFDHPVMTWAAGESSKTTRDTIQRILMGDHRHHGTGLIPGDLIVDKTTKAGLPDALEDIYVKHVSGGISHIGLKSYEQGAGSFMGTERHIVWFDEEPPLEIYTEGLTRTMIVPGATPAERTTGMVISTFTPLNGLSQVVENFMPNGRIPENGGDGEKFIIQVTWDEVPHLTKEMKDSLWASLPPHERSARSKGVPQLGAGKIYTVDEDIVAVRPFDIPRHWPRFFAMDIGFTAPTAVVWFAWDRENDVLYIYREHYRAGLMPWEHAHYIKNPCPWIPGVIDPAAEIGRQADGVKMIQEYDDLGLTLYKANNAVNMGIIKTQERLQSGRLKVFNTCVNWFEEYRLYRWDKDGRKPHPKQKDHAMDATRYGVMSGLEIAVTEQQAANDDDEDRAHSEGGKSKVGGY
jgi:phage terminase large subunit-like protein